jgi:hypothetical protein
LKVGDRVKCFPTNWHFENKKCVTGKVVALEVDNTNPEYLVQVEIEYSRYRQGTSRRQKDSICGGSIEDWILGLA